MLLLKVVETLNGSNSPFFPSWWAGVVVPLRKG